MTNNLKQLEDDSLFEVDGAETPPTDIVAYNELRSCADLFRMHAQKILDIQPEFQRDVVWPGVAQTRFVDSLIKQLPIPSMCFGLDNKQQKWIVIDGLQRMHTIVRFLEGGDWTLSKLPDIDQAIAGKSVAALKPYGSALHSYYTRVENLSIPITVLRCDFTKKNHLEYLNTIFHRLNAGGIKLNNQEIRNCIYGGPLNSLLRDLDKYPAWRKMNRMKAGESYRFTKQERILRFLSLEENYEKYDGHLATFLNNFMFSNRSASSEYLKGKALLFSNTVDCLFEKALSGSPPSAPATVIEAALVGIGRNLEQLTAKSSTQVAAMYRKLTTHAHFQEAALAEGLSKKPKVIERLDTAVRIFAGM